jgi:hypothetical protein
MLAGKHPYLTKNKAKNEPGVVLVVNAVKNAIPLYFKAGSIDQGLVNRTKMVRFSQRVENLRVERGDSWATDQKKSRDPVGRGILTGSSRI